MTDAPTGQATIEFLLPIRLDGPYGARQAWHAKLLFASLARRWQGPRPRLVVTTPAAGLARAARLLARHQARYPFELVADEDIVLTPNLHRLSGWVRQMLVKLGFARVSGAPFYLTLDADVLLLRPTGVAGLVHEGRANTAWESTCGHPEWWAASAAVLEQPVPAREGLSVTPNVLATDVARATLDAIEAARGQRWDDALARAAGQGGSPWTEYSLYSIAGAVAGLLPARHLTPDERAAAGLPLLFDAAACVWGETNRPILDDLIHGRRLDERLGTALFYVLQGTMPLDVEAHGAALRRHLLR